jgi:hypothetical protein
LGIPPYRKTRPEPSQKHSKTQSKGPLIFLEKISGGTHPQGKTFPERKKILKEASSPGNENRKTVYPLPLTDPCWDSRRERACV